MNYNSISDVSRQSSHRESRPLLRSTNIRNGHPNVQNLNEFSQNGNGQQRNLLQTISGVLHSQSVRLSHGNNFNNTQANNSNIGIRGASLHHINDGARKANGFATLHYPPNHSNARKSVIDLQHQQPFVNSSHQRATSFMVHNTGNNLGNIVHGNNNTVSRFNGSTIVNSGMNGDRIISVDPVTGQAVAFNANGREAFTGQPTYISSSLSDGGMFVDGNNLANNSVLAARGEAQNRLAGDNINGNNPDLSVSPGTIVRQLIQQHRKNNATSNSNQQLVQQNTPMKSQTQTLNSVSSQQPPMTTAGPVSLPQPQFAHPIASATAAKI